MGERIEIIGGHCLRGTVTISGSKNAALPMMCACLLTDGEVRLNNVPISLSDVNVLVALLQGLGVNVDMPRAGTVVLRARYIRSQTTDRELASRFRNSICVLGPLLARCGRAEVHQPGGCPIGERPINFHTRGLRALGANVSEQGGVVVASSQNGLTGAVIDFLGKSVGATENLMMAACLACGTTTLSDAAMDPEVVHLGELLNKMGADIKGLGTPIITVHGKCKLQGAVMDVIPDRIETGTWMIACCLTRGKLCLDNTRLDHLAALVELLQNHCVKITEEQSTGKVTIECTSSRNELLPLGSDICTASYPGFPTDLQAPFMTLLTQCRGTSTVTETIFENRFKLVTELRKLGADIVVEDNRAIVTGVSTLNGARVSATDIRAGAALVLAALVADGKTRIDGLAHLDRGYEFIVEKLFACGAQIKRF